MKKSSLKKITINKVEKYLKKNQYIDICNIIKNENPISIIAKFSFEILIKYLKICSKSKNIDLYLCMLDSKIVGYSLFALRPKYLITEFKSLNFFFYSFFN